MRIAVVGAGIVGLAVAYEALLRDHHVTCIDAADPMAARPTGDTRIFRHAHRAAEHVQWAERARQGWDSWEKVVGRTLAGRVHVVRGDNLFKMAPAIGRAAVAAAEA